MSYTRQQQATHCRQLADYLESLPAESYDHDAYVSEDGSNGCGTVACALGHAGFSGLFPFKVKSSEKFGAVFQLTESTPAWLLEIFRFGGGTYVNEPRLADAVFGNGAFDAVFSASASWYQELEMEWDRDFDDYPSSQAQREAVIKELRARAEHLENYVPPELL